MADKTDSILKTIRDKRLGDENDTNFDTDLLTEINSALMNLTQIGVGPKTGFRITGEEETWSDFVEDRIDLEGVKTYVDDKTRLGFDPPVTGFTTTSIENRIRETEFRLSVQAEEGASNG